MNKTLLGGPRGFNNLITTRLAELIKIYFLVKKKITKINILIKKIKQKLNNEIKVVSLAFSRFSN